MLMFKSVDLIVYGMLLNLLYLHLINKILLDNILKKNDSTWLNFKVNVNEIELQYKNLECFEETASETSLRQMFNFIMYRL